MHSTQTTPSTNGASAERGERVDVAVIGAGQAGLALGHFLARSGRGVVILEAGESVATAWRERWDSLVLFTPRRYDALPEHHESGMMFSFDVDAADAAR